MTHRFDLRTLVISLAFLSSAAAQIEFEGGFDFEADPLTKGDLAVWGIFTFVYVVLSGLSLVALAILKGHRRAYCVLLFVSFLSFIHSAVNIPLIVIENNVLSDPPWRAMVGLISINAFTSYWIRPLLFLALLFLIDDRYAGTLMRGRVGAISTLVLFGYICFLASEILGTAASGLLVSFEVEFRSPDIDFDPIRLENKFHSAQNVLYAFTSVWATSSLYVVWLALHVHLQMRKLSISDKFMTRLIIVVPFYLCLVIVIVAFTIVFSPAGVNDTTSVIFIEQAYLANDILQEFFTAATVGALLGFGLQRENWKTQNGSGQLQGTIQASTVAMNPYQDPYQYQSVSYPHMQPVHTVENSGIPKPHLAQYQGVPEPY